KLGTWTDWAGGRATSPSPSVPRKVPAASGSLPPATATPRPCAPGPSPAAPPSSAPNSSRCCRTPSGTAPRRTASARPWGQTPVLHEWQTRDHLSVMGGLTPAGKVYVLARPESLNGLHTVEFLEHLARHAGRRLLVIWDGSPIHRREAVLEFLGSRAGRGI